MTIKLSLRPIGLFLLFLGLLIAGILMALGTGIPPILLAVWLIVTGLLGLLGI